MRDEFLIVRVVSYKYRKKENENQLCSIGLELRVMVKEMDIVVYKLPTKNAASSDGFRVNFSKHLMKK